ncbi:unnamed protein product, partial [Tetraodon nigroviridis]
LHYGKESVRSSGGADLHNFISSGFVTLGRGHPKGKHSSLFLLLPLFCDLNAKTNLAHNTGGKNTTKTFLH